MDRSDSRIRNSQIWKNSPARKNLISEEIPIPNRRDWDRRMSIAQKMYPKALEFSILLRNYDIWIELRSLIFLIKITFKFRWRLMINGEIDDSPTSQENSLASENFTRFFETMNNHIEFFVRNIFKIVNSD